METLNNCENCKFYNRHYTIFAARLSYANCGNCKNCEINANTARKIVKNKLPCEYFEQAENEPPVSRDKLQSIILQMKKRLDDLLIIIRQES